jgi:hypothetical protein
MDITEEANRNDVEMSGYYVISGNLLSFPGGTEEITETASRSLVARPAFEPDASVRQVRPLTVPTNVLLFWPHGTDNCYSILLLPYRSACAILALQLFTAIT